MKRRVVHVGPSLDGKGGIASVLSLLAESRLARAYDLTFETTSRSRGTLDRAASVAAAASVSARALASRDRLYHIHMSSNASFWRKSAVAEAALSAGHTVVVHAHSGALAAFMTSGGPTRLDAARRVLSRAHAVLAVSSALAAELEPIGGREVTFMPNPVRIPARTAPDSPPRIVFAGRLAESKGVFDLVDALGALEGEGVAFSATIAGDGDVAAVTRHVERTLRDPSRVSVPGWLDPAGLARELELGGVFCLPSYSEGLPLALLEAMAYRLAPVATRVGGVADALEDGVSGVLVEAGDAEGLASALGGLLGDEERRRRMAGEARSRASALFGLDSVADRLIELYTALGFAPDEEVT